MSGGTEPGWHNDPLGRHESRYWDGTQWTEHVSDGGVQSTDPVDGSAPSSEAAAADPTQPVVTSGGAYGAASPADEGLQQYANTGAQKSGGFPIVPVVIGLVVAAVVVGALVFFVGGGDDGGEFGTSTVTIDDANPVQVYELKLDRGEGVRFRAVPQDPNLDPVFAISLAEGDADALFTDALSDELIIDAIDLEDLFTDVAGGVLTDFDEGDTGIARGELYELESYDCCGTGETEAHSFVAPRSATYSLLLYDYFGADGEIEVDIEQWEGRLDFDGLTDFVTELDDITTEDSFFSDDGFFSEFADPFSDFSDADFLSDFTDSFSDFDDADFLSDFSDAYSDFTDADFFSDFTDSFSDFSDTLSDFGDPFSDFSDFSDLSDFSDVVTDFIDPFTDLFTDLFSEFTDFEG